MCPLVPSQILTAKSAQKDDTIQVRHNLVCQEVLIAGMVITGTQQCFKNTEDVLKILTLGGSYQLAFSLNIVSQNVWQRWVTCHQTHFITQSKRGELVSAREQSFCGQARLHMDLKFLGDPPISVQNLVGSLGSRMKQSGFLFQLCNFLWDLEQVPNLSFSYLQNKGILNLPYYFKGNHRNK